MARFALFILILACLGCSGGTTRKPAEVLPGSWRLYDVLPAESERNGDDLLQTARRKQVAAKGRLLSIFPDGTYTELEGEGAYHRGRWQAEEETLQLKEESGEVRRFGLALQSANQRDLILLRDKSGGGSQFIRQAAPLDSYRQDPFYAANNEWRIRPGSAESEAQLIARLGNYFRHLACLLKASDDRKEEVVSFEFSRGPVKIYNGGIGIHPMHIVPADWVAAFHSNADAFRAYRLYERYLQRNSYHGASTGRWVTDDYNILLSIYADLKDGKFSE
ncbi:hypothetical protein [Flaviaesturariibacter amylovorans]|uniref:Uncharacterized protein n=1 Tax=Flaviaesturariibacter amylovorans TaxID=1084520 RepID=A0ABP8GXA7_9BACT